MFLGVHVYGKIYREKMSGVGGSPTDRNGQFTEKRRPLQGSNVMRSGQTGRCGQVSSLTSQPRS